MRLFVVFLLLLLAFTAACGENAAEPSLSPQETTERDTERGAPDGQPQSVQVEA